MDAFFRLAPLDEWRDVELNSPLDDLYLTGDKEVLRHALKEFKKNGGLKGFRLASHESIGEVMEEIAGLEDGQISPTLFESYSENLRKAVSQVFKRDSGNGLSDQLRANVSKFAAYKAYEATNNVRSELGNDLDKAERILRTYNRTQATEYNTTISRSRTAKQFEKFESSGLFPNLRWLPSRSADPRESHMLFWDRVWAKDDPFWNENTPGSLWNCKCDWEETDDPVTAGNPGGNRSARGLKGNPAETGEVFSDDHPYILREGSDVLPFYRMHTRQTMNRYSCGITFNDKYISYDSLNIKEMTKGSIDDKRFFLRVEIIKNFDKYIPLLIPRNPRPIEDVDIEHNTHGSKFLRRKRKFEVFEVYTLRVGVYEFEVKLGRYKDGTGLNLYSITDIQ